MYVFLSQANLCLDPSSPLSSQVALNMLLILSEFLFLHLESRVVILSIIELLWQLDAKELILKKNYYILVK